MDSRVLVTYATRMGSTREVAERIADTLRESGLSVELQPAKSVRSLETYCAVALCAALYMGRLHKNARNFLATHRTALAHLPVGLFVLGPVQKDEKDWIGARQQLDKELNRIPWLCPALKEIVGGKFDPTKMGFPFNLLPALRKMPASDVRDWAMIRNLVSDFALKLRTTPGPMSVAT